MSPLQVHSLDDDFAKLDYVEVVGFFDDTNPNDNDDSYIVNAGFKFICYTDPNYAGIAITYDNSDGEFPSYFVSSSPNQISSLRLYYRETEIIFPNIS